MKLRPFFLLALAAVLLSGCSTIKSRIEEKASTFAALDAPTQEKIRKGMVELNYTPDMVYMALGRADERSLRTTAKGQEEIWVYTSTYEEYMGTAHAGYRRVYVHNPRTGATYVYLDPVYTDVYQDKVQENIRIIFRNGKVEAIEQAK